jgi:hypothetical protein
MVIKSKSHKIQVSDMFREDQLKFLTRKINPNVPHLESRAAILEHLVDQAMENPKLLEV